METKDKVLDRLLARSNDQYLVNIVDVARLLGISRGTALNWRWKGTFPLPVVKLGKKVCVRATDLAEFLGGTPATATATTLSEPLRKRSPGRPRKMARAQGGVK
jgi:predicted DNA-binding transcriptional regulator AlpA